MKSWYESKTIWLGLATIATAVVSAVAGGAGWQQAVLAAITRIHLYDRTLDICKKRVYGIDPLVCPKCASKMSVIAFINDGEVIEKILCHIGRWRPSRGPRRPRPRTTPPNAYDLIARPPEGAVYEADAPRVLLPHLDHRRGRAPGGTGYRPTQ